MDEREGTRILIAGGQAEYRLAMRMYLQAQHGLEVVGEAADGRSVLEQAKVVCPDLVLLEWDLPGRPAADLIAALRTGARRPLVVAFGKRPESSLPATNAGADAYVYLGQGPREVVTTIRWVALEALYA